MRIHNFRAGFATNSSSSHSVILLPPRLVGKMRDREAEGESYGWDQFRLVSEDSKLRYLAAQLLSRYGYARGLDDDEKLALSDIMTLLAKEMPKYHQEIEGKLTQVIEGESMYSVDWPSVDHQSALTLPDDPTFLKSMFDFFRSPRVMVLGGNDNGGKQKIPKGATSVSFLDLVRDVGYGDNKIMSRRDGSVWVLFDSENGNKARLSFDNDDLCVDAYTRASAPELVDVKITNYCTAGCNFCYMASTPEGQHAPFERIEAIGKLLGEMQVFEVAIGGGEPTTHPEFARILRMFRQYNIVPNFTTFSNKWLDDPEIITAVAETVGGIGVSCLDGKGLRLVHGIKTALQKLPMHTTAKVAAQHVVGSVPLENTVDFIKQAFAAYTPVLLLGFKEVGFGKTYERHDGKSLETFIKLAIGEQENRWAQLSVDTALLDRYPDLPEVLGVPQALVTGREGAFSCYIDATTGQMGPSSYVEPHDMLPLATGVDAFKAVFAGF